MAKIFVFDLDDTLYKEIDFLNSAYKEIASKLENDCKADIYSQMIEWYKKKLNVFDLIISSYNLNISLQLLLECYRNHFPNINLSVGAEDLFDTIVNRQWKIGLISDGRSITQRNKIKALNLNKYIADEDIIISEEFGSEKPDYRNYQYFEKRYPGSEFVYIADNPKKDFVTPNKLGWMTIGLLNDGRNIHHQNMDVGKEYLPQKWVKSLKEISTIL